MIDRVSLSPSGPHLALSYQQGLVPDLALRFAIRSLLSKRLREVGAQDPIEKIHSRKMEWIEQQNGKKLIAECVDDANKQHYEVRFHSILVSFD